MTEDAPKYKAMSHPEGLTQRDKLCPTFPNCRCEMRQEPLPHTGQPGEAASRILGYWCDCDYAKQQNLDGDPI